MIILASDYIGWKVIEFMVAREEKIDFLIVDRGDKNGYNQKIDAAFQSSKFGKMEYSEKLKDDSFLDQIAQASPKIGILAWWPNIIKDRLLSLPTMGWVNFHPSLLPYNRGKHPNFWTLVDETPAGVTLHFINSGIDSGKILAQRRFEVGWEDTGETVYYKARESILELFKETYDDIISGQLTGTEQNLNEGTFHKGKELEPASCISLDMTYTARKILNLIRARMFENHPTACFYDGGKKYSVKVIIKEIVDD